MLVYDDRWETRDARDVWHDTAALIARVADGSASHDDLIATLIAFGAYESAQADALCPTRDEPHPTLTRLRAIAELLGRAVSASIAGDRSQVDHAVGLAAAGCRACDAPGHSELRLRVPEGYAFYSLYPESYAEAIIEWAIRVRPERVVALGLRSIGTSLSAAVTGALTRVGIAAQSWTLRPRGHPFDRRIDIAPSLAATLPLTRATILIVDEGPGLSGSSMTATAAALSALGVPDEDVVFVPSWQPDPATFVSSAAADRWRRHRAIVPTFDGVRRTLASDGIVPADAHEISAGAWRAALHVTRPWPAVHPQHERRKFLLGSGLARFAGLGAYGEATARRATALAAARWSAPSLALRRGFLVSPLVKGTAMRASDASSTFLTHAASYIAWLRSSMTIQCPPNGHAAHIDNLNEMLRTNTREALGADWLACADALARQASGFSEPLVAIDGRMQPHEWLSADAGGWSKTDALDHHRDHFLPGCTDAAWDVAGFIVEWDLAEDAGSAFVGEYVKHSGDCSIRTRLPYFKAAYVAFRTGYCTISARALEGTEDGARFQVLAERYRETLRVTLASARPAVPSAP